MQIEILKDKKEEIKFKIIGKEDHHSIGNLLRNEAFKNKEVVFAAYKKEHPLTDESIFILKTNGKTAKSVLKGILKSLSSQINDLKAEFENV